jgi:hypothetical protein
MKITLRKWYFISILISESRMKLIFAQDSIEFNQTSLSFPGKGKIKIGKNNNRTFMKLFVSNSYRETILMTIQRQLLC